VDDTSLTLALAGGDEDAFQLLVERSTARVYRTCYRILGRIDEAEDATQETFVLAFRALGNFRGEGSPEGWLVRIATRLCWRRASQATRARARVSSLSDATMGLLVDSTNVGEEGVAAEERESVRRAVAALPEPYREVVSLRFFGDLTLAEIAAATGRGEATVKTHLYRGLARVRGLLEEDRS
jgi:RNA polymerase sigma-70 factor (ECF subfamily)